MVKKVLLIGAASMAIVVLGFVGLVAMQPSEFQITRSVKIAAPPEAIFSQINDFHKWPAWSPWEALDPDMQRTYSGATAGEGAIYGWTSNHPHVGEGRMTITESRPGELIAIKLEFIKPHAGICPTEFKFTPDGYRTKVTWTMSGKSDFMHKAVQLFMNMDKLIGGEFEKGLAKLKQIVEEKPAA